MLQDAGWCEDPKRVASTNICGLPQGRLWRIERRWRLWGAGGRVSCPPEEARERRLGEIPAKAIRS